MTYFETRRKQKIEDQLSDAIAEEEAIADITAESQQVHNQDLIDANQETVDTEVIDADSSISSENTEDKTL